MIIPIYGIRTVYTGFLNGLKRFDKQAIAQVVAAVIKLGLVAVFLYLKMSLGTIILAYFFAAAASLFTSFMFSKIDGGLEDYSGKKLVKMTLAISVYSFAFPLLMSVDLFLVKYFTSDASLTGYYNSATTLSRFLYVLFSGFMMSLLPIVSGHFYKRNMEKVQLYCRRAIRFGLMFLLPFSLIASLTGRALIPFVYSSEYLPGVPAFSILIFGIALLTITRILLTLIVAVGKQNLSLYLTLGLLALSLVLNFFFIPKFGIIGAAWATTTVGIIGLIVVTLYLVIKIKKVIKWISLLRIAIGGAVIGWLSSALMNNFSFQGLRLILWYGVLVVVYFVILLILREITKQDLNRIKAIISSKLGKSADSNMV